MFEINHGGLRINGRELLRDVSLQLHPGELLAVLGPNGAGKSSLLRTLAGEWPFGTGEIRLNGRPLASIPRLETARLRAVMPQADRLSFPFSVTEVVLLGRTPHAARSSAAQDERIVHEVLVAVDSLSLAARDYTTLSGGERQRVQLARALAQIWDEDIREPRFLLLDEPTASLDLAHQHGVLQLLNRLKRRDIGILVVLHDLNLAARYADRVALLKDGKMSACGPSLSVMTETTLSRVYSLPIRLLELPGSPHYLIAAG